MRKPAGRNAWCERFGIDPPPVEDLVGRPGILITHLVVAALLERGAALSLEELAERIGRAGFVPKSGDVRVSIVKGWHGSGALLRESDGRFTLELASPDLDLMLFLPMKLRGASIPSGPERREPTVAPAMPAPDVPLGKDELAVAFARLPSSIATLRILTALLDARGEPAALSALAADAGSLLKNRRYARYLETYQVRKGMPIRSRPDGRLELVPDAPEVRRTRELIRELEAKELVHAAQERVRESAFRGWQEEEAARLREEQSAAALRKKRVIHLLVVDGRVRAAASVDVEAHCVTSHLGDDEIAGLVADLRRADVIAGLGIRDGLRLLGIDPDGVARIDLSPPQKTIRLNRAGRVLRLTPELIARSTTQISRPLADRATLLRHLEEGSATKLRRRLEADAKALFAMWRYGAFHHHVRVKWGFLDVLIPAHGWALSGEVGCNEILKEAFETQAPIDVVLGESAPGWKDPWARARPARVERFGYEELWLRTLDDGAVEILSRYWIQAARPRTNARH